MKKLFNKQLSLWLMIATTMSLSAATYTVTTTADAGAGSLRQAITDANTNAGIDTINFNITSGPHTLIPATAYPTITEGVVIDGTTEPGSTCGGSLMITIDFSSITNSNGMYFNVVRGGVLKGLNIVGARYGSYMLNSSNMTVKCCYIGTNNTATDTAVKRNTNYGVYTSGTTNLTIHNSVISGAKSYNVYIVNGDTLTVTNSKIGTDVSGNVALGGTSGVRNSQTARPMTNVLMRDNVLSGNTGDAVLLYAVQGGKFIKNMAGTNAAGTASLQNTGVGIRIEDNSTYASYNVLIDSNVLSANQGSGIYMHGTDTVTIKNNFIGTNATGTAALLGTNANGHLTSQNGIYMEGTTYTSNKVLVLNNVISGNVKRTATGAITTAYGAFFRSVDSLRIQGNKIGTNAAGTDTIGNSLDGIHIEGYATTALGLISKSKNIVIGGPNAADRNIISGNRGSGIDAETVENLTIENNYIGTNAAGTAPLLGWSVRSSADTTVFFPSGQNGILLGQTTLGRLNKNVWIKNNLISGNIKKAATGRHTTAYGLYVHVADSTAITGNKIGTNAAGTDTIPNYYGIFITSSLDTAASIPAAEKRITRNVRIGGPTAADRNIITGNHISHIYINNIMTTKVRVENNYIGFNAAGTAVLPTPVESSSRGINLVNGVDSVVMTQNRISGMHSANRTLLSAPNAIILEGNLVNDLYDAEPNSLNTANAGLNKPLVRNVFKSASTLTIEYMADLPAGNYRAEVFNNPAGTGEQAHTYVGSFTFTHTGAGNVTTSQPFIPSSTVNNGDYITMTFTQLGSDIRTSSLSLGNGLVRPPYSGTENCTNGYDDDGDGLVDCFDPGCSCYTPLYCDNGLYQGYASTEPTAISDSGDYVIAHVDAIAGALTPFCNATEAVGLEPFFAFNGLASNPSDGFLYIYNSVDYSIYRLDANGKGQYVSTIWGVNGNFGSANGCMNIQGDYFIQNTLAPYDLYKINPLTGQATLIISNPWFRYGGDMAFNPVDGKLWGSGYSYTGAADSTYIIDHLGATRYHQYNMCWMNPVAGTYGAIKGNKNPWRMYGHGSGYFDAFGTYYGYNNTAYDPVVDTALPYGQLLTYNFTTDSLEFLSQAPKASGTDGASCPFNIALGKVSMQDTVKTLDTIVYQFSVVNTTAFTANNINFRDVLGKGVLWASTPYDLVNCTVSSANAMVGTNTATFKLNNLVIGKSKFKMKAVVPCGYTGDTAYLNKAYLSGLSTIATFFRDTVQSDDTTTAAVLDSTKTIIMKVTVNVQTAVSCAIASGEDVTLDASGVTGGAGGYTYLWSNGATTSSIVITPTANTQMRVTVTDALGCSGADTIDLIVFNLTGGNDTICHTATLPVTITGHPSISSYTWSTVGGATITPNTGTSVNINFATSSKVGAYDTIWMITNGACGIDTVKAKIFLKQSVSGFTAGPDTNICAIGSSATYGMLATLGTGTSGTWQQFGSAPLVGINGTTSPTQTVTLTSGHTYNVRWTVSNGYCSKSDTVNITVNNAPIANAGVDKSRVNCAGDSVQIGSTAVSGVTYAWSPTTGLSSSTAAMPFAKPITTTTYTVVATNTATGCTATDDMIVNVTASTLFASAGTDKTVCLNATGVQIGGTPTASNGNPGYTYSWTPSTSLSSATIANPTVTTSTAFSNRSYALLVTDSKGCIYRDTAVVSVNALPTANAGPDTFVCVGLSVPVGSTALAGVTYSWSPSTGLSSSTAAKPDFSIATAGTYTLTVTATTTATGCTASDAVVVTVNGLPTANAGSDKTRINCAGDSVQIGTTAVAGHTYVWSPATNLSSTTVAMPWAKPTATTTYVMTITNTTTGCMNTDDVLVTVNNSTLFADAGADKSACINATAPTLGAATVASAGTPTYTYAWSPSTGLSSATASNPTVSTATAVTTSYALLVTDSKGCIYRDTAVITINPKPAANYTGSTAAICGGATRTFTPTPTGGTWQVSAGSMVGNTYTAPNVTTTGTVTISYTVSNSTTGCDSTITKTITVNPNPDLSSVVLSPATACVPSVGGSVALSATALTTGQTGAWTTLSSSTGTLTYSAATSANTNVSTLMSANTYILRWTVTASGCSSSKDLTINTSLIPEIEAGNNDTICPGQSITLTATDNSATPPSYSWKANTITSTTLSTTTTVTVAPTITTNYIFTAAIGTCTSRDTAVVAVVQRPILSDDLTCQAGTEDVTTKYPVSSIRANDNLLPVLKGGVTYTVLSTKVGSASIANDTITYVPTLNYFGTDTVTVVATSNMCTSLKDTSVFCITVAPVNDAPVATNDTTSLLAGGSATLNLLSNDSDVDNTLTGTNVSMIGTPTNGSISGPDASGNITYTPAPGFVGVDSVKYQVCDNGSPVKCDTAYAYFNVGTNLVDTTMTTDGVTTPVTVGTPITPASGTSIIATVSGPVNNSGTATINPTTGVVTFVPNDTPFVGKDTITRTICTVFATDTVCDVSYIIIDNPGVDVVLRDTTPKNTPTTFAALTPIIFEGIAVAPVVDPTLTVNADGTVTYTPPTGFVGTDTATIVRCDHLGNCVTTTYIVHVTANIPDTTINTDGNTTTSVVIGPAVNPAPGSTITSTDVSGPSNNSGTATINPTTGVVTFTPNDTAFVGKDTIRRIVCVDGACDTSYIYINNAGVDNTHSDTMPMNTPTNFGALTPVIFEGNPVAPVVDPRLTINADGTVTYTPLHGFVGVDTATITRCDNLGNCVTDTYIVTISPVLKDTTASTPSGTTVAIGSPLTLGPGATVVPVNPTNGTVTVNPDGTLTYTPKPGFVGTDTVLHIVCVNGICDTSKIVVTVTPPVIKLYPDIAVGNKGETISGNLSTNDDIVPGTTYGTPIASSTNPSSAVPIVNPDGTYTFTATVPGVYTFTVPICPPGQTTGCPTQTLTITVLDPGTPSNPPIVNNDAAVTKPNAPVTVDVLSNDASGNPNTVIDPASVTITKQPTNGTATVGTDGKVTYTPKPGFEGKDTIYYRVCDNATPPNCGTAFIVVEVTKDADKISTVNDDVISGSGTLTGNVLSNDKFPVGSKPNVKPETIVIPGKGTFTIDKNGNYTWTPLAGFTGSVQIPITVCDGLSPETCYNSTVHILSTAEDIAAIPNYFSPNGDGVNDVWNLDGLLNRYPNTRATIYNRWGNIVWRSTGAYGKSTSGTNLWYGQLEGSQDQVPDGVYYYLLELEDEFKTTKTGFIEVMRQ